MSLLRHRITTVSRCSQCCLVLGGMLTSPSYAWAANTGPFGAGLPDGSMPGAAWFPHVVGILISLQVYFNQHITAAVRAMHDDGSALWTLLALSFLYGIVHAAGPGHGKAVVSSYVLANRQTLRNGILLAFIASLAQALGAIVLILIASTILHMTSVSITESTFHFELISDILIVLLGLWLVWTKIVKPARSLNLDFTPVTALTRPDRYLAGAASGAAMAFQASDATTLTVGSAAATRQTPRAYPATGEHERAQHHEHYHYGCDCGHAHVPDATVAAGSLDLRKAWAVVASTALRPCTGALIVLVFSISQGLMMAGIAATLVMGLGTAITVASLAVLAVSARKTALLLTRADGHLGRKIIRAAEICGALAVLTFGVILLAGTIFL